MTFRTIAIAVALSVAASAALADDQTIVLTPTGPDTFAGAFNTTQSMGGLFVDTFKFTLPAAFSGSLGSGTLTFAAMSGPVSLILATLDGVNGFSVASPPGADKIVFPSFLTYSKAQAPLILTVLGFAGDPFAVSVPLTAGYGGSISFAVQAVPEPETYVLMLAGLAAMGSVAGRRKAKHLIQTA